MANVNISVPNDLHKKARQKAVDLDISLKELIIQAIKEKLRVE